jgi:esterase/lipase
VAVDSPDIAGLLLFSPALVVRNLKAAYLLQFFKKYLDKSNKSNDQEWKGYNVYPMKGAVQLLRLQRQVRKILHKITQPIFVVVSEADKTVKLETGETIINAVSSKKKKLTVLENSSHTMLLDHDNQLILDQAIAFVEQNSSNRE